MENKTDFVKNKNYDDVFLRDLYASLCYFFLDTIKIKQVVKGEVSLIDVPVLPSSIGDERYLKEFFTDLNKICNGCEPSVLLNQYPSGRIIMSGGYNINTDMLSSNHARTKKIVNKTGTFFDEQVVQYGRNTILGLSTTFNVEFRTKSSLDRMKLVQKLWDVFHKERYFTFTSCGVSKIPATVQISDSYKIDTKQQFKFAEFEGFYELTVSFDLSTMYVVDDSFDQLEKNNFVDSPTVRIHNKN